MKLRTVLLIFLILFIYADQIFAFQARCKNCEIRVLIKDHEASWGFYKNNTFQSLETVPFEEYLDSTTIKITRQGDFDVNSIMFSVDGGQNTINVNNSTDNDSLSFDFSDDEITIIDGQILSNSDHVIIDISALNDIEKRVNFFYRISTSLNPRIAPPNLKYEDAFSNDKEEEPANKNQTVLIPKNINFLPGYFPENQSISSALDQTNNKLLHYKLIYDFRSGSLVPLTREGKPQEGKFIAKKQRFRVRPAVGRTIALYYTNLNTANDSLDVKFEFKDFHTDGAESFISNVGTYATRQPASDTDENGAEEVDEEDDQPADAHSDADGLTEQQKNTIAMYHSLANQLKRYYEDRASTGFINANQFESEIEFIEAKIKKYLSLDIVTSSAILNSGKKFSESLYLENKETPPGYRDSLLDSSEQAAEYWSKIKNALIYSWGDIQIKNQDTFILELQRYRNKKPLTSQPISYEFLTKGGLKIDFSTGFFLTGLKDDSFITQNVQDTVITTSPADTSIVEKDKILKKDTGNFDVGAGALMHIYPRTGYRWGASLSAGFIVDSDIATKLLGGGSLLFGKEKRVVLTVGVAVGKVERLGTGLNEGDIIDIGENQTTEVPTRDVWRKKWFVGLTYNF